MECLSVMIVMILYEILQNYIIYTNNVYIIHFNILKKYMLTLNL